MQPWASKVQLTRPPIASQPAFNRHFDDLLSTYPKVHNCNLLGTRDMESQLTRAYDGHARNLASVDEAYKSKLSMTHFDFHSRTRAGGGIETIDEQLKTERKLIADAEEFGFCLASSSGKGYEMVSSQEGVFRTNCLDWCVVSPTFQNRCGSSYVTSAWTEPTLFRHVCLNSPYETFWP